MNHERLLDTLFRRKSTRSDDLTEVIVIKMDKKFYNIKLKAGALQYTIFISVVIALLVFAFISLTYVQNRLKLKASFFQEVVHNTDQGFKQLAFHEIPYNEDTTLSLPNGNNLKTKVTKKHWGLFDLITTTSIRNNETFTKTGLLGGYQNQKTALYLQDNKQPLVVVGSTKIEGKTHLPKQGVKRGTIAGNSYKGQELIYGTITQSSNELPGLQNINHIKTLTNGIHSDDDAFLALEEDIKLINSFNEPTTVIRSPGLIDLRFVELAGNILISSRLKITVHPSAKLKDVILIAPEIEIKPNTTGNFQAFASKEIKVGRQCKLAYPTALFLTEKKSQTRSRNNVETNQLYIDKGVNIKGVVAFISEETTDNYKAQIIIEESATVTGEVYCDRNLELNGAIEGSVYTASFIANEFGSVYKNHIYNGQILASELPSQYVGLTLKETKQKVVKWLY